MTGRDQPRVNEPPRLDQQSAAVLERARRTVEERRTADATSAASRQRPWLLGGGILALMLLGWTLLWPGGRLAERLHRAVRGICDQRHNLASFDGLLPFDARCTGIYTGVLATLLFLGVLRRTGATRLPARSVLVAALFAILFIAVDGFNSWLAEWGTANLYAPHNALRLASGIASGAALSLLGIPIFNQVVRAVKNEQEVCTLVEALGIAVVAMLFGLLLWFGGPAWLFAPLAVFGVAGAFVALVLMHLFGFVVLAGMQRTVVLMAQLARPLVISMAFVVLELVALAALRGATP